VFSVIRAILTALATNDSDACVDLRAASIVGTVLTGIGIILAAAASFP
jgi:hypothetical protein